MKIIIPPTSNVLKRYLLFFGSPYYPVGGMNDLLGQFDNYEDAATALDKESEGSGDYWAHIFDTWEGKKILSFGQDDYADKNYLEKGFLRQNIPKLPEPTKEYEEVDLRKLKGLRPSKYSKV